MPFLEGSPLQYVPNSQGSIRRYFQNRAPTSSDYQNFGLGDEWLDTSASQWWKLADRTGSSGTWIQMAGGGSGATDFIVDSGTSPVSPNASNELTVAGGTGIQTVGSANTITINADADVATTYDTDSGSAAPAANVLNIVGGANITTSGAGDTVTITSVGPDVLAWTEVTGTSQALAVNRGYVTNNAGLVTCTLPVTAAFGTVIVIAGKGAGGWSIAQNAGQTIHFLGDSTTTGVGGSLAGVEARAAISLVCETANTDWVVYASIGNFTVT